MKSPNKASNLILNLILPIIAVLVSTLVGIAYLSSFINDYSELVNTSGKIRGGIQRFTKTSAFGHDASLVQRDIDAQFDKLESYLSKGRLDRTDGKILELQALRRDFCGGD